FEAGARALGRGWARGHDLDNDGGEAVGLVLHRRQIAARLRPEPEAERDGREVGRAGAWRAGRREQQERDGEGGAHHPPGPNTTTGRGGGGTSSAGCVAYR